VQPYHLIYRKPETKTIVNAVQEAKEKERLVKNPRSFKTKQLDIVDLLIEKGSEHPSIQLLLKHYSSHNNLKTK
jgi:hypothetical protein